MRVLSLRRGRPGCSADTAGHHLRRWPPPQQLDRQCLRRWHGTGLADRINPWCWVPTRGAVRALAISPDGTLLASAGSDGTVRVHTLTGLGNGRSGRRILDEHDGPLRSIAFNVTGSHALTLGEDGTAACGIPMATPASSKGATRRSAPRSLPLMARASSSATKTAPSASTESSGRGQPPPLIQGDGGCLAWRSVPTATGSLPGLTTTRRWSVTCTTAVRSAGWKLTSARSPGSRSAPTAAGCCRCVQDGKARLFDLSRPSLSTPRVRQ